MNLLVKTGVNRHLPRISPRSVSKLRSTIDYYVDVDPGEGADIRQLVSWLQLRMVYQKQTAGLLNGLWRWHRQSLASLLSLVVPVRAEANENKNTQLFMVI